MTTISNLLEGQVTESETEHRCQWAYGLLNLRAFVILLMLLVSGCSSQESSTPTLAPPTPSRTAVRLGPTSTIAPSMTPAPIDIPTPTLHPLAPISDADWSKGPHDAPVTLVVYSDFQ
ncbi:MAG: hypothetical protein GTO14_02970 [Anaerolineales bacterium]|nr:hypothetical protein [Anaerolineales bacterium]